MRLAVIGDEVSQDLDVAIAACLRHGFDGLEIRSVDGLPPHCLTGRELTRIGERVRAAGVEVAGFASPVFKTPLPEDVRSLRAAQDALRWGVDGCRRLGAEALRVFTFLRDDEPHPAAAARALSAILADVELDGVVLAVETGTRTHTPAARHLRELLDLVGHPALSALWDPGNSLFAGVDVGPLPSGLELLWPGPLRHVHVKDPRGRSAYVMLGHGDIDWLRLLDALRRRGFAGWVSLETHWRHGRALSAAERDEPWGADFSAGGLEASDICMSTLARWVRG